MQVKLKMTCWWWWTFVLVGLTIGAVSEVSGSAGTLFPYGPEVEDAAVPKDSDDTSAPEFRLKTPIKFFHRNYESVYVNQNGLISFLTDIPTFVNIQFPLDYPSIAAFYSDVDVREAGDVFYRETQDEALLERAGNLFKAEFSKAEGFEPASLLIVTWDGVGYFDRQTDKLNTYQLVIASDGNNSYAVLQYEKIEWIQGQGKNPSLPDARAQAAIISGHGPYHALKGSGTDQVSSLHKRSNFGEPGSWAFKISDEVSEPDLKVNGGSSSETSASCATAATSCHSKASCIDYDPGFCCACGQDTYGNGRVCLRKDVPVRVSGKVRGLLNSVVIDDSDLFSYVLPEDGRAYTAISKIPERLGYDLQTVTVLGTIIGWLFSTSEKGAPNGFTFTGGILNYTAEISFYQTGQKVTVNQHHMGLDVFNSLRVDTRIYGATPVVPIGKVIELNDFEMKFTRVSPGLLRSRSSHYYRVDGTSQENPFSVEQTIEYHECPWAAPVPPELGTLSTIVGRNYIIYDPAQQISRFATTTSAEPVDEDPCQDNKDKCGPHSSCVVEGSGYKCICDLGYELVVNYEDEASGAEEASVCVDVDECRSGKFNCDATAICINTPGSHKCECRPGYSGDGFSCHKVLTCSDVNCAEHGECVELAPGLPECRCLPDYYGNGLFCYPRREEPLPPGAIPDCRQLNICDPFAECVYSPDSNTYGCKCRRGYTGDGEVCDRQETESCEIENNCHADADCKLDPAIKEYVCNCRTGFVGDGYTCTREEGYQSPEPVCDFYGDCQCPPDWEYDEIKNECVRAGIPSQDYTCEVDPQMCDANANCERTELGYTCVCRSGFSGDGRRCMPQDTCSSHAECSQYGFCTYDDAELRYVCRCREGFAGNGKECTPTEDFGCDVLRNCDVNANCVWDPAVSKSNCECNPGYIGDGLTCEIDKTGCNYLQNCHRNAECLFDSRVKSFRCICKQGFEGDGLHCRSDRPCYEDRSVCDPNAECAPIPGGRDWKCQCRDGFTGNGIECREAARRDGSFLLVTKGMSIIKVPTTGEDLVPLAVEPFQTAVGIDIDCPGQVVYWGDVGSRTIKQVAFNGTGKSNFLSEDIGSPEGLSVDWAAHTVYWTDSQKDTIEVAHLDTKMRKTIISKDLVNPRGIAVYSQRGRLFWSDWNRKQPKIEFSGLDGQDREILVSEGLALPNSLIVDPETDSLCWADADTHQIECIGIDGRNRRVMITGVKYPFGLAMSPEHFYWTDWTTRKIESAGKITGKAGDSISVPLGGVGKMYGLVFVPPTCVAGYSPCAYNPCSENKLCLQSSRGTASCVCPEGASADCQDSYN